mmetsp:Transcript_18006/g.68251  ORF Transcript_18006/g.68251 Transcript_18006/m.68251 type:complete len:422 (+) Transcript_18006:2532-3797(+)
MPLADHERQRRIAADVVLHGRRVRLVARVHLRDERTVDLSAELVSSPHLVDDLRTPETGISTGAVLAGNALHHPLPRVGDLGELALDVVGAIFEVVARVLGPVFLLRERADLALDGLLLVTCAHQRRFGGGDVDGVDLALEILDPLAELHDPLLVSLALGVHALQPVLGHRHAGVQVGQRLLLVLAGLQHPHFLALGSLPLRVDRGEALVQSVKVLLKRFDLLALLILLPLELLQLLLERFALGAQAVKVHPEQELLVHVGFVHESLALHLAIHVSLEPVELAFHPVEISLYRRLLHGQALDLLLHVDQRLMLSVRCGALGVCLGFQDAKRVDEQLLRVNAGELANALLRHEAREVVHVDAELGDLLAHFVFGALREVLRLGSTALQLRDMSDARVPLGRALAVRVETALDHKDPLRIDIL